MIVKPLASETTIAFIDQYSFLGGGQVVMLSSIETALKTGWRVLVAAPAGGSFEHAVKRRFGSLIDFVNLPEMKLSHGKKKPIDFIRIFILMPSIIRVFGRLINSGATIFYLNGPRLFPFGILFSRLFSINCHYHIHIDHSYVEKWVIYVAAISPKTKSIIINSKYIFDKMIADFPRLHRNSRLNIVPNPLDSEYSSMPFVNRFKDFRSRLCLIVVGTMRPEKGQDLAIWLASELPAVNVHLVGRIGEGAEKWVIGLKEKGTPNVSFHEESSDIPALFDKLGVHVSLVPSQWQEPFGLVSIEGMACSCIGLVSRRGGLVDIASDTGALLFDGPLELRAEVARLLTLTSHDLQMLAKSQHAATISNYRTSRFSERMLEVLQV